MKLNKKELIKHLELCRDGNTYENGFTDVELSKEDLNFIINILEKC